MGRAIPPHHSLSLFNLMARGRVGGIRTKKRGAVGSTIYQIRHSSSGQLEQVLQSRPESREYSNTDAQIKARMIMGQIQRMFHVLPGIIKTGFYKIPRGTLSFQHFAKINRPLLEEDFDTNFDDYGDFDWRPKRDVTAPAGRWVLTEGSLPEVVPDNVSIVVNTPTDVQADFNVQSVNATYGALLDRMGINIGDSFYIVTFRKDSATQIPHVDVHEFLALALHSRETRLDDIPEGELFGYKGIADSYIVWGTSDNMVTFNLTYQDFEPACVIACFAFLIVRRYSNGAVQFSSSRFRWYGDRPWRWFQMFSPWMVYQTWANV